MKVYIGCIYSHSSAQYSYSLAGFGIVGIWFNLVVLHGFSFGRGCNSFGSLSLYSGDFSTSFKSPCIVFAGHPSLRFGPAVHLLEAWGGSSKNALFITEPGFDYLQALGPYQPLAMKVCCVFSSVLYVHAQVYTNGAVFICVCVRAYVARVRGCGTLNALSLLYGIVHKCPLLLLPSPFSGFSTQTSMHFYYGAFSDDTVNSSALGKACSASNKLLSISS